MPPSAFRCFPFAACMDIPGGTRQRVAPLRHPIPSEERCAGQMVQNEMSSGHENTDARAKISSTSEHTSFIPKLRE